MSLILRNEDQSFEVRAKNDAKIVLEINLPQPSLYLFFDSIPFWYFKFFVVVKGQHHLSMNRTVNAITRFQIESVLLNCTLFHSFVSGLCVDECSDWKTISLRCRCVYHFFPLQNPINRDEWLSLR